MTVFQNANELIFARAASRSLHVPYGVRLNKHKIVETEVIKIKSDFPTVTITLLKKVYNSGDVNMKNCERRLDLHRSIS